MIFGLAVENKFFISFAVVTTSCNRVQMNRFIRVQSLEKYTYGFPDTIMFTVRF
jgi:hypothetical protein